MWGVQLAGGFPETGKVRIYGPVWHLIEFLLLTLVEFPLSLVFLPVVWFLISGSASIYTVTGLTREGFTSTFKEAVRQSNLPSLAGFNIDLPAFDRRIEFDEVHIHYAHFRLLSVVLFYGKGVSEAENAVMASFRKLVED